MASIPASPDNLTGYPARFGPNRSPADAELGPVEPPLFRFRLRQLFYFVSAVSFILAATVLSQGVAALAMLLAALVVAAHLFSTALASRLRSRADNAQALARALGTVPPAADQLFEHSNSPAIPRCARSPWHARGSTSLPWLPRLIVAGVIVGGTLGACVLGLTIGHRTTLAGVIVGGLSSAVLGGWFAFLCGSFYGIFRHGLRDAIAEQKKDEGRTSTRS
jgi:hypothetical protein